MKRLSILLLVLVGALAACVSQSLPPPVKAFASESAQAYEALGLSPSVIAPWEDGMRTDGARGTYEWWYFDFTFSDGTTLVIGFYTKNIINPDAPLDPTVTLARDRPDGTTVHRSHTAPPGDFFAAKDRCEVKIGASTVSGDLHDYALHVQIDDVQADLTLHGTVPPWRPGTGHLFFGQDRYFAWLPSVPQGTVSGTVAVAGQSRDVSGVGYHDHNWGNASMADLIHHWYWGRAQVGPYTVIASDIFPRERYGSGPVPIFMLARDGDLIADDASKVHVTFDDMRVDGYTHKPVANVVVYDYVDGPVWYRVTFRREKDLLRTKLIDVLPGPQAFFARLAGFDGAYLRFTGTATVERLAGGSPVEDATERAAVWELMYFGH